jgi:hypothetical protein
LLEELLSKEELAEHAFIMQRLLIARLFYLGGGQRRQIYANFLLGDISWQGQKMMLYVLAEKVARLNTSYLPLPPQLYTSIEFFIQRVRPQLFAKPSAATEKARSFWVNSSGGALKPEQFSEQLRQAFNEFNPDLDITAVNFRRMVVTALFASMYIPFFAFGVCYFK